MLWKNVYIMDWICFEHENKLNQVWINRFLYALTKFNQRFHPPEIKT